MCNGPTTKLSNTKNHAIIIMLGTILIACVIEYVSASYYVKERRIGASISENPAHLEAVEAIIRNMNASHEPCDNFYLFACGKFVKGANVPKGQGYTDSISKMTYELQRKLKDSLKQNVSKDKLRAFKLLRSYYKICLNADHTGNVYRKQILDIVNDFGGWPVLAGEFWNVSKFDWKDVMYKARKMALTNSMSSLFHVEVDGFTEKRINYIRFDEAITSIDRNNLKKGWEAEKVQDYYNRIIDIASFVGANKTQALVELKKVVEFEINLAKISQFEHHLYNIHQLNNTDNKFPWHEYFKEFLPSDSQIDSNTNISIDLKNFESTLNLIKNSEKRTVANYLIWRVAGELMDFVNFRLTIARDFSITPPEIGNRYWMNCVDYVTKNMPLASAAFYVRNYINETLKTDVLNMSKYLRKAFEKIIFEASWINNSSKTVAHRKLESMQVRAAYLDEFFNDQKLDYYFENLPNPTNNFFKDHLALMQFNYENKLNRFIKYPNENNDWTSHNSLATVDLMYHNEDNSIDISAGFWQEPFFSPDKPNYLNYGGIGYEIAHAISHGFDEDGSRFNENGNEENWWDSETINEYKNRARCFIEQYNKFKASKRKIPLNGEYTLKENIADSSGFKIAYRAYEDWEEKNGQEPSLPGLPYTPRQLFWISAANTMCTRFRRKGWDLFLKNERSPAPFRIIGSFSNIHEFASDFGCPVGSRMNPIKKCSLW